MVLNEQGPERTDLSTTTPNDLFPARSSGSEPLSMAEGMSQGELFDLAAETARKKAELVFQIAQMTDELHGLEILEANIQHGIQLASDKNPGV